MTGSRFVTTYFGVFFYVGHQWRRFLNLIVGDDSLETSSDVILQGHCARDELASASLLIINLNSRRLTDYCFPLYTPIIALAFARIQCV